MYIVGAYCDCRPATASSIDGMSIVGAGDEQLPGHDGPAQVERREHRIAG